MGIVGLLAVRGLFRGFFREACGLLALAVGLGASLWGGGGLGRELAARWGLAPGLARSIAHALLFLGPYVVLQGLGYALHRLGRAVFLGGLDRAAGALFGAAAACLLAGAGLGFAARSGWGGQWLAASRLAKPLQEAFQRAIAWASQLGA